ncbi:MAG TPA: PKD domain-containing protein [Flavisolibacter sp.]|nr:PKD domain-containing protein [Flavisolibacter sp.]
MRLPALFLLTFLLPGKKTFSQYILNGSASKNSCNCYTLTPPVDFQSGSVWNANKISLANPFDFWFNVFLGCTDSAGADGMVFILQPLSTSVGSSGEGMGFGGVAPSIGIALDTYQNFNLNDPAFDHISIQANGIINHSSDLAGPVPISSTSDNVEDCKWHKLRIAWDPSTKWLRAWFNGVLRVEKQVDLVTTIFGGDPNVYWGFTGATGGSVNLQQFCTALDPIFNSSFTNNAACAGEPITFTNQSESFAPIASYNWSFGNGNTSTLQNPPPQSYSQPGIYDIKLMIRGLDGCESDTTVQITIGSVPEAAVSVNDTCFRQAPSLRYGTGMFGVSYHWRLDGGSVSVGEPPVLTALAEGQHEVQLVVTSLYNCGIPDTAISQFTIKPLPVVDASSSLVCNRVSLSATQLDNRTVVSEWKWDLGNSRFSSQQQLSVTYPNPGNYEVRLWALGTNGCSSDTVRHPLVIPSAIVFAGHDTTIISDQPFQLQGSGNGSFLWSPSTGLSNPTIANPIATITGDQEYILTVTTPEGCIGSDTVKLRPVRGPAVYVPGAFTPNGDGLNDVLRPVYVGIKTLERFEVYSRWGQRVFSTSSTREGWDGKINQQYQGNDTFVWFVKGINYLNQPVLLRGTVTIIK